MNDQNVIAELTKKVLASASDAIASAVQAAVEEAFRAGEAAARQRVLAAIGGDHPATQSPAIFSSPSISKSDESGRRAPRGLTKEVVTHVLRANPNGLPLETVQEIALEVDPRLVEKTVYNELMRGRLEEYRYVGGKWRLATFMPDVTAAEQSKADDEVAQMFS